MPPSTNTHGRAGSGRLGVLRSEVKEEPWAQPGAGDMNGVEPPGGLIAAGQTSRPDQALRIINKASVTALIMAPATKVAGAPSVSHNSPAATLAISIATPLSRLKKP